MRLYFAVAKFSFVLCVELLCFARINTFYHVNTRVELS